MLSSSFSTANVMNPVMTIQEVLLFEKLGCVPASIDLRKWKHLDATGTAPAYEEEEDGTLQFYNGETGRPCRNLCEFEKDLLNEFWSHYQPTMPLPSFKDLEIWRQRLSTPGLDLWEAFVKARQTPAQKEERDESINEWRQMMHDSFWHKEQKCSCKSSLFDKPERPEETFEEILESVRNPRSRGKTMKKNAAPETPSKKGKKHKAITKKEAVDEAQIEDAMVQEGEQQEDEEDAAVKTPRTSARNSSKKKAADKTPSKKRKTPSKAAETPDTTDAADKPSSKKRKTTMKAAEAPDTAAADETPSKRHQRANVNLVAKHAKELDEMVSFAVKKMHKEAAATNKTPIEVIEGWTGLKMEQDEDALPVRKPKTPARKSPQKVATTPKKAGPTPKKEAEAHNENDVDPILAACPVWGGDMTVANETPIEGDYDLGGLTLAQRYELQMQEDVVMQTSCPTIDTPKRKTPARKSPKKAAKTPDNMVTDDTPSKKLNLAALTFEEQEDEEMMDAPVNTPTTPAKRKTPAKNAATQTRTKKSKTSAKKNADNAAAVDDTPTKKGKGVKKEVVEVEKSDSIILF